MVFTSLIAVRLTLLAPYVLLFIPLTMTHVCVCVSYQTRLLLLVGLI